MMTQIVSFHSTYDSRLKSISITIIYVNKTVLSTHNNLQRNQHYLSIGQPNVATINNEFKKVKIFLVNVSKTRCIEFAALKKQ